MGLFLFRFWPVLIPLLIYWIWLRVVGQRATIAGKPVVRFADGPWYWAVLASLLVGAGIFILLGASEQANRGTYVPAHMENGTLVPPQVQP
jgi:hypothetical protein